MRKSKLLIGCAATLFTLFSSLTAFAEAPIVRVSTNMGHFDIELYPDKAPASVENFLKLVDDGFYEGLVFHRVLANFVIQTGGYMANLEYRDPPGTVVNESNNGLSNSKGTVAMARRNDPDSADAQFFVNVKDNDYLDATPEKPGYTVFGQVVGGWEIVETIELVDVGMKQGMQGVPTQPVVIESVTRVPAEAR